MYLRKKWFQITSTRYTMLEKKFDQFFFCFCSLKIEKMLIVKKLKTKWYEKYDDSIQVNLFQKPLFFHQLILNDMKLLIELQKIQVQNVPCTFFSFALKPIFVQNMFWTYLFLWFNEQSLVILWFNWFKNKNFWHRSKYERINKRYLTLGSSSKTWYFFKSFKVLENERSLTLFIF